MTTRKETRRVGGGSGVRVRVCSGVRRSAQASAPLNRRETGRGRCPEGPRRGSGWRVVRTTLRSRITSAILDHWVQILAIGAPDNGSMQGWRQLELEAASARDKLCAHRMDNCGRHPSSHSCPGIRGRVQVHARALFCACVRSRSFDRGTDGAPQQSSWIPLRLSMIN